MFAIILTLISLIILPANCETCAKSEDFISVSSCFKNTIVKYQVSLKDQLNQILESVKQCMVTNQCVQAEILGNQNAAKVDFFGKTDSTRFSECQKTVVEPIRKKVEACVQTKYEGFSLVSVDDVNTQDLQQHGQLMATFLSALSKCPTENVPDVIRCTKSAFLKSNNTFTMFCDDLKQCSKAPACSTDDVKKIVCSCTNDVLNTTNGRANQFEDQIFECLNMKRPNMRRRLHLSIFVKDLVKEICDNDICAKLAEQSAMI